MTQQIILSGWHDNFEPGNDCFWWAGLHFGYCKNALDCLMARFNEVQKELIDTMYKIKWLDK